MSEDEILVMIISGFVAVATGFATRTDTFHRLYLRGNPAPGIVRLGVILSMAWIGFVLWRYADPSVTGIYVVFYLVMGYAVVKLCGQLTATLYGARTRVDAVERRNVPAALVIAAFTLATGLICAVSREYTVHSTEYHTVGGGQVCTTCGVATKSRAVQAGRRCAAQAEHSRA